MSSRAKFSLIRTDVCFSVVDKRSKKTVVELDDRSGIPWISCFQEISFSEVCRILQLIESQSSDGSIGSAYKALTMSGLPDKLKKTGSSKKQRRRSKPALSVEDSANVEEDVWPDYVEYEGSRGHPDNLSQSSFLMEDRTLQDDKGYDDCGQISAWPDDALFPPDVGYATGQADTPFGMMDDAEIKRPVLDTLTPAVNGRPINKD